MCKCQTMAVVFFSLLMLLNFVFKIKFINSQFKRNHSYLQLMKCVSFLHRAYVIKFHGAYFNWIGHQHTVLKLPTLFAMRLCLAFFLIKQNFFDKLHQLYRYFITKNKCSKQQIPCIFFYYKISIDLHNIFLYICIFVSLFKNGLHFPFVFRSKKKLITLAAVEIKYNCTRQFVNNYIQRLLKRNINVMLLQLPTSTYISFYCVKTTQNNNDILKVRESMYSKVEEYAAKM